MARGYLGLESIESWASSTWGWGKRTSIGRGGGGDKKGGGGGREEDTDWGGGDKKEGSSRGVQSLLGEERGGEGEGDA